MNLYLQSSLAGTWPSVSTKNTNKQALVVIMHILHVSWCMGHSYSNKDVKH